MSEEQNENIEVEEEPLKVEIITKEKEEKNPTSEDTEDPYNVMLTEEEIQEMQDIVNAQ